MTTHEAIDWITRHDDDILLIRVAGSVQFRILPFQGDVTGVQAKALLDQWSEDLEMEHEAIAPKGFAE